MFTVAFQNIGGMHDVIGCKADEISRNLSSDIEIIAEVWGCNCELHFEDYTPFHVPPQKHLGVKKGRKSGGFFILIKNNLEKKVKVLKKSNNFVWIEVEKSTINNFQKNFLIVASYIHDVTSTYYNDKIFDELQRDILTFCTDDKPVMLIGDLNGRTGSLNDLYEEPDTQFCSPITQRKLSLNVPIRINCDVLVNSHGEKIIKLCKTFDLIILNGRLKGDAVGNFTHLNKNNGPSAIDYCICSNELYGCIDNFIVLPLTGLSDHSKIVSVFKEEVLLPGQNSDTYKWNLLKKKFKWNEKAVANFKSALINNTSEIEEISQRIDAGLVNSAGEKNPKPVY